MATPRPPMEQRLPCNPHMHKASSTPPHSEKNLADAWGSTCPRCALLPDPAASRRSKPLKHIAGMAPCGQQESVTTPDSAQHVCGVRITRLTWHPNEDGTPVKPRPSPPLRKHLAHYPAGLKTRSASGHCSVAPRNACTCPEVG